MNKTTKRSRRIAFDNAISTINLITGICYIRDNGFTKYAERQLKRRHVIEDSDDEYEDSEQEDIYDQETETETDEDIVGREVIEISSDSETEDIDKPKSVLDIMQYDDFIPLKEDDIINAKSFKHYHHILDTDNVKNILSQMWQTPYQPVKDLVKSNKMNFPKSGLIWDPCCGMGSILAHIKRLRPEIKVRGSDLGRHGYLADARYLKSENFEGVTAVVTNPPYNHSIAKPILDNLFDNWNKNDRRFSIYLLVKDSMIPLYFYHTESTYPHPIILAPSVSRYKYVRVSNKIKSNKNKIKSNKVITSPPFSTYWLYIPSQ